jgi:hypothetical protein
LKIEIAMASAPATREILTVLSVWGTTSCTKM